MKTAALKTPQRAGVRFRSQVDACQLFAAVEPKDGEAVTLRIPVLPEGTFEHPAYGTLEWTGGKFAQMIDNFQNRVTGFQPMLNCDHSTHNPFAAGAPAAGWLTALETVAGEGLFAMVELTPMGAKCLQEKTYRYISAEVGEWTNSLGQTYANVILGAALTNVPFHDTMPGLFGAGAPPAHCFSMSGPQSFWAAGATPIGGVESAGCPATEGESMSLLNWVRRQFSLADDATEIDAAVALATNAPVVGTGTPAAAAPEPQKEKPVLDTLTLGRAEVEELRKQAAEAMAFKQQAADAQKALAEKSASDAVEAFIEQGKITPKQREKALEFALRDPVLFGELYAAAEPVISFKATGHTAEPGSTEGAASARTLASEINRHVLAAKKNGDQLAYADAAKIVAREYPDLYTAHRAAAGGK